MARVGKPPKRRRRILRDGEFWFDEEAADRAETFFPRFLVHIKGEWAGQPFVLEPWQRDGIVRPLFGWKRKDGTRRYRTVYVEVPRKQGKSTVAAGIALYLLYADHEPGGEIFSAAADRDQAAIVFDLAKQMVLASPELRKISEIYKRSIVVPRTGSAYHVLSADAHTKHGKNASGVIFDELHAQPNRELWDVLNTSTGARRQPVTVAITTAGYDRESICFEVHDYACKVRDGVIRDETFLPVIYAASDSADWKDPVVWNTANPGLGKTVKLAYLEQEARKAGETPSYQNTFRRLHLNQWTQQNTRFIDLAMWDACSATVDVARLKGRNCMAGLDLSSTTDLSAFVLLFPPKETREDVPVDLAYDLLAWFWMPEENIAKKARKDRVPYEAWVRDGFIHATPGNVVDYDAIREKIIAISNDYYIDEIALDRWNATQISTQLEQEGMRIVPYGQGYRDMSAPTKDLEALIVSKRIRHGGNPVLRWMADNVSVKQDPAGNLKPDKAKSTGRIDGIVALVMALGRANINPPYGSIYEKRGLFIEAWKG
jgi:phage terminase large subunit-like protein